MIKVQKDDSDDEYDKHKMYTQTRFFDPDMLSFKPMVYPNIEIAKHV